MEVYTPSTAITVATDTPCFEYGTRLVCPEDLVSLDRLQSQTGTRSPWVLPSVEDQGCCSAANPYVPYNVAPVVLVFDIFLPGVGTIIAAYFDPSGCNCKTITCGIFQMLLTIVLVGWVWSIV